MSERLTRREHGPIAVLISADAEWLPTKEALQPLHLGRSPYGEFFTRRRPVIMAAAMALITTPRFEGIAG